MGAPFESSYSLLFFGGWIEKEPTREAEIHFAGHSTGPCGKVPAPPPSRGRAGDPAGAASAAAASAEGAAGAWAVSALGPGNMWAHILFYTFCVDHFSGK